MKPIWHYLRNCMCLYPMTQQFHIRKAPVLLCFIYIITIHSQNEYVTHIYYRTCRKQLICTKCYKLWYPLFYSKLHTQNIRGFNSVNWFHNPLKGYSSQFEKHCPGETPVHVVQETDKNAHGCVVFSSKRWK